MASSGPASPVKTQSPEHGQKLCLGRDSVAIAKTANMVRRVVVELPKSEVATAEKIDSTVGCFPGEGSSDSWFAAVFDCHRAEIPCAMESLAVVESRPQAVAHCRVPSSS
jgi:hypothetical protein